MKKKRELIKARLIKDMHILSNAIVGILCILAGIVCMTLLIYNWASIFAKLGVALVVLCLFMIAFVLIGGSLFYVALKDRYDIKNNNFAIFTDKVLRIEAIHKQIEKRVYFEEYTKYMGFGAVNLAIDKLEIGEEYFLIKLPSSNFVALAYPCDVFKITSDMSNCITEPQLALQ